jgi:Carboxypeptidase regulatory-like domain
LLAQSSCPPGHYQIKDKEVAMGTEETKHDLWLKRINTWIAILGGSVASVAGTYNFLPSFFPPAPGHIAAVVREQGGTPVPRAHVELLTSENVLLVATETDRDGRFSRNDIEAGSYIVKVSRASFETQVAKVSIASKKTTDLALVLKSRPRAQVSNNPQPNTPQPRTISQPEGSAIRSALEETGAAWIKNLSNAGR